MTRTVVAVDTGGTFTDLVANDSGTIRRLKVPSTPDDPGRAVREGLKALSLHLANPVEHVRHGTTVATNAVLERRGAAMVLITTAGFEDVLRLRRQNRPDLYALHPEVEAPLAEPECCVGVAGRRDPSGAVVEPLEDLGAWVKQNRSTLEKAETFGICLLHSYAHGEDEIRVRDALSKAFPATPITVSHELVALSREFERTSTVSINAFVAPVMQSYLRRLEEALAPATLSVMGSAGGLMTADAARREPVHTVLSGPAGGVRGAWAVGQQCKRTDLLSLDMGGTSTDISVVQRELLPDDEGYLAEHPLRVPLLPIETVGAGGGSIAYLDDGGALRVGPRSAGAVPGPAAYGNAGPHAEPTVTDANVVLGRLPELLGGTMELHVDAARAAVQRLADAMGVELEEAASGIIAVANATMARACKRATMERGIDPRSLSLVAFGGAGGLHACDLADELGCRDVLFPAEPGVLSAEGILLAPFEASISQAVLLDESAWTRSRLSEVFDQVREGARGRLGDPVDELQLVADCRYVGQSYTLSVHADEPQMSEPHGLKTAFQKAHDDRYGYTLADRPLELVALRAFARRRPTQPEVINDSGGAAGDGTGPTVLSSYSATLWVPQGWRATAVGRGNILCERLEDAAGARPQVRAKAEALALEIHRQQVAAIAEEMGAALMGAAFSANIKERRDFSCAVFDGRGRMLVQAAHIPVHLGSQPMSVEAAIAAVDMTPETHVILNDPYAGGTHLPDVTLVSPVFLPGRDAPDFYVANRAHHADVGGISPGSMPSAFGSDGTRRTLTIDDEGWRTGPVRLTDEVKESFAAASRTTRERYGDLSAQVAANNVGRRRLIELVQGLEGHGELGNSLESLNDALLDYAERRMRSVIRQLPEGEFHFEDHLDDDGFGGPPLPIPVTVRIGRDTVEVDFRDAPDQVTSGINAVRAIAVSAVFYVFRTLAGEAMPANAGLLRPIEIHTRPGSICDAKSPAAVSAGNVETSQRLVDAVYGALAQASPRLIPAASCGSMNNVLFGGEDPRPGPFHGRNYVHYETLAGGAGASAAGHGASAIHTHMTNTLNTPVEELEREFPVRIRTYRVRDRDGANAGNCGGSGIERAYEFLGPVHVTLMTERRATAPWSVGTNERGTRGENVLIRQGVEEPLGGKSDLHLDAGDIVVVRTPGGGHWRS